MLDRIRTEPALVTGLIRAVLLCVTAFGFNLSAEQVAAVMLVAEAVLSLFTRASVVPVAALEDEFDELDNEAGAVSLDLIVGVLIGVLVMFVVLWINGRI